MSLNFDAEIKLDIGPFLASIQKAQAEVKQLSDQIDAVNKKTLSIKSKGTAVAAPNAGAAASTAIGAGSAARISAAKEEISLIEENDAALRTNIKTQYEADKMWQKSSDARLKDHQVLGRRMDDQFAAEAKQRSIESNQIKTSMQERAAATSKYHNNASVINDQDIAMSQKAGKQFSSQLKSQMQESQNAQNAKARMAQQAERNLSRERYALYDVAAAYTAIAGAATAAVVSTAKVAIEYERAFANVQRTTDFTSAKIGEAAASAKFDLKALASEIPVAFGQITEIATIGNQLGIAQGAITAFTETVAKFSATTGVSVDQTAMAFGRIGQLLNVPANEFENLGSSIAFAGVNAVATEEQILSVTKEIATTAKMAKFSTPDIIGLSTALSSLGIAPEAARGSIIRTFAGINKAISEGGDALDSYANIAGMSAEQFSASWQENGEAAFSSFLGGLQGMSDAGQNLDTVLRDIGMKNVRDIQTIQKLGDNYDVYTSSLQDANQGFKEGIFLGEAYSVIQDTVAAKLQVVSNNWNNLLDTLGQGAVGEGFKDLLDAVNALLVRLNALAKSPLGDFLAKTAMFLGILVASIAAMNAVSALAGASVRAFATAQEALTLTTTRSTGALGRFGAGLNAVAASSQVAAGSLNKTKIAVGAVSTALRAAKWFLIIAAVTAVVEELALSFTSARDRAESMLGGFAGLQDALTADFDAYNTALSDLGGDVTQAEAATGVVVNLSTELENNNVEVNKTIQAQNMLNEVLGITSTGTDLLSTKTERLNFVLGENTVAWIKNAVAQSEGFQKMAENTDAMQGIIDAGFKMETAIEAAASGNLDEYINKITWASWDSMSGIEQLVWSVYSAGDVVGEATKEWGWFGDILTSVAGFMGNLVTIGARLSNWLLGFVGIDLFPISNGLQAIGIAAQGATNETLLLGPVINKAASATDIAASNSEIYAKQLDKVGRSAGGASRSLRTVIDYANDLGSVFARTFEINFGRQEGLDSISSGWAALADSVDTGTQSIQNATQAISQANAEILDMTATKSVLAYQLTVAERYGDEARAAIIRAKIAKIDEDMANQKSNVAAETEKVTDATKDDNKTDREKRALLLDQVKKYADLLEMYAKTGMKKKGLTKQTELMKQEFVKEASAIGISQDMLGPYVSMFDDLAIAVKKTPRDVDVKFNSNISAADQAVKEYLAKLNKANGTYTTTVKLVLPKPGSLKMIIDPSDVRLFRMGLEKGHLTEKQFYKAVYGVNLNLAQGGPVNGPGTGTSDSIPAMLSNGEYVIKASAVSAYGVDFFNALNQQKVPAISQSANVAGAGSGSTIAYLSPEDRSLLRAVIDRPVNLYTENAKIASSANAGNVVLAQRGTN